MAEIKFEKDIERGVELPIWVGRIILNDHTMRIMFCPDGKMRAVVSDGAVKDGSLILEPDNSMNVTFKI